MAKNSTSLEVGKQIARTRRRLGLSQGAVSRRTGLHPSYLSRIENGRVQPTIGTTMRVAEAMRVTLDNLFGESPVQQRGICCPVSSNGSCLMDLVDTEVGPRALAKGSGYTPRQLRLLRRFTGVLEQADPDLLKALEVLLARMPEASAVPVSAPDQEPNRIESTKEASGSDSAQ